MSATDEVRRMLGEAGIEYKVTSCRLFSSTKWECDLGNAEFYEDHTNGYTRVTIHYKDGMTFFQINSDLKPPERYVTPAQAIAATLGRGTCRMNESGLPVFDGHDDGYFSICSECGFVNYMRRAWLPIKFCPNCGRRVGVDE